MNKTTNQVLKYTVILLIVGAILVVIGGLSVGRSAVSKLQMNMSAEEKIGIISNENLELKTKNKELETQKSELEQSLNDELKKNETFAAYVEFMNLTEQGENEKAAELVEKIDKNLLPDYAVEKLEKLNEEINEETE